jgi:hypothetical protein
MAPGLEVWVVYDHPRDYPDHFVARRWEVRAGEPVPKDGVGFEDLDRLRAWMEQQGLAVIPRFGNDDPCIIEAWM